MLKCSIWKCKETPTRQCNSCNRNLFCKKCFADHSDKHIEQNIPCQFGKIQIKLSKAKAERLRRNIKELIKSVEYQKKNILIETLKINKQIKNMIKLAFKGLDQMINEYKDIYNKAIFQETEFVKVQSIMNEEILFEYPILTINNGKLTKIKLKYKLLNVKYVYSIK